MTKEKLKAALSRMWEAFTNSRIETMMLLGLLLFVLVIVTFTRRNYVNAESSGYQVHDYNQGWVLCNGEQQSEIMFLPEKYPVEVGSSYTIKNQLPQNLEDGMVLTMHSFRANVSAFIDGRCVYRYEAQNDPFAPSAMSRVSFIPLTKEDSGKEIHIQMQSYYTRYSGRVDEFFYGPYQECVEMILHLQMPIFLLYAAFLVIGAGMLLALPFIRKNRLKYLKWAAFGLCVILFSINIVLEYNMVQFWVRNDSLLDRIYWITLFTYPVVYLIVLCLTVKWKWVRRILKVFILLQMALGILLAYWHMSGTRAFCDTINTYRIILYVAFFITILLVVCDMFRRHSRRLLPIFFSQGMILQVLWVHVISFYYYPLSYQNGGLVFAAGILSSFIILSGNAINKTTDSLEEVIRMKKDMMESRVQLMIHQIQPHFIFNTLNSIQALIDLDPEKASEMLTHFSRYLRTHIDTMESEEMILFREEMQNIKEYLSIETMRFPRLNVIYEIGADMFLVPALSIQPLVENAVKHGISPKMTGGNIWIQSWEEKESYVICIRDNGVGFDDSKQFNGKKTYVGMKNVTFRLNTLMNAKVKWDSEQGQGTAVTIQIPKKWEGESWNEGDFD